MAKTTVKTAKKTPAASKTSATQHALGLWANIRQHTQNIWTGSAPYRAHAWLFAFLLAAIIAPQVTLLWKPIVGAYVTAGSLAALIVLAARYEKARNVAISAAILPLVTMVNLCLPQSNVFAQTVVYYDALLLLALVYRFMFTLDEPVKNTALTAKGYAFALPLMLVLGQVLGVLGYVMLRNHYNFVGISLPLVAAASVVFALAEETYFRGLLQQRAAQVLHPTIAAALVVVGYAVSTLNSATILPTIMATISGLVLSLVYYKKQNLILTIAINAMSKLAFVGLLATFVLK